MTYDEDEPRGKIAPKKGIPRLRELIAERNARGESPGNRLLPAWGVSRACSGSPCVLPDDNGNPPVDAVRRYTGARAIWMRCGAGGSRSGKRASR